MPRLNYNKRSSKTVDGEKSATVLYTETRTSFLYRPGRMAILEDIKTSISRWPIESISGWVRR